MYVYTYVCMYVCINTYVCACVKYMHVCMHPHIQGLSHLCSAEGPACYDRLLYDPCLARCDLQVTLSCLRRHPRPAADAAAPAPAAPAAFAAPAAACGGRVGGGAGGGCHALGGGGHALRGEADVTEPAAVAQRELALRSVWHQLRQYLSFFFLVPSKSK